MLSCLKLVTPEINNNQRYDKYPMIAIKGICTQSLEGESNYATTHHSMVELYFVIPKII